MHANGKQRPSSDNAGRRVQHLAPQPQGAMTVASARMMAVSLTLTDTPIGYKAQKGPSAAYETLVYNARDGDQPANFNFSNVSPQWTHSWQAYIQDDPNHPGSSLTRILLAVAVMIILLSRPARYTTHPQVLSFPRPTIIPSSTAIRQPAQRHLTCVTCPTAARKSTASSTALPRIQACFSDPGHRPGWKHYHA